MKAGITMTLAACLGSCVAGAVLAAEPADSAYVEVNYAALKLSGDGISFNQHDLIGRGGYNFNRNFGVEVMAAAGLSSEDIYGVTLKMDSAYGTYLKAQAALAPHVEVFARAGWAHITLSSNVVSGTGGDSSFSYGAGFQFPFTKNWYVQAEYNSIYDKDGISIKGPAIGMGYRF